jgi:hypothetical protein
MSWNDPRWQQLYPPRVPIPNPVNSATTPRDSHHYDPTPPPNYLDLIAAEARANPAPFIGTAEGVNISEVPGGLI